MFILPPAMRKKRAYLCTDVLERGRTHEGEADEEHVLWDKGIYELLDNGRVSTFTQL